MHVTAVDLADLAGRLTEIEITWDAEPARCEVPVTFNQGNHVRAQLTGSGAWLAGTVTLPDRHPDRSRIVEAVTRLLVEHDALRARIRPCDTPRQDVYGPDQFAVRARTVGTVWHGFTTALITERCRAGEVPGLFFGILDDRLVCAFDHAHADAFTIDLVLRRLYELYADPDTAARTTRSFAQRCVIEATGASVSGGPHSTDPTRLMQVWEDFFTITDATLPAFPLPLGSGAAPQRTVVVPLLSSPECHDALGRSAFAHILATLATAVASVGGPRRLATLIPVHTRGARDSGWHDTAGWMVSNAPVVVDAGDPDSATRWLTHAAALTDLPLDQVLAHCRPSFVTEGIFMVSYLDYRKLGPALPGAQHISAVTRTDTAQFWFNRSESGLDLRVRYPGRPEADAVMADLLRVLTSELREPLRHSMCRTSA
ncbi:hypothetical protein ABLE92_18025 [Gordonia sp. VNQ95]|jgi:hypothetical protein|uniref:hypothetical protein n=1 Tax=Gordonia TaxID=2053 RepID=UPI0032B4E071